LPFGSSLSSDQSESMAAIQITWFSHHFKTVTGLEQEIGLA
jgi:hypothetical protein